LFIDDAESPDGCQDPNVVFVEFDVVVAKTKPPAS
jgi:hypothetical protein